MTQLNYEQFIQLLDIVDKDVCKNPYLRTGQSLFNNLIILHPEFEYIRSSSIDPFYNNEKVLKCLEAIVSYEARQQWLAQIFKKPNKS